MVMVLLRLVSSRKKAIVSVSSGRWIAKDTTARASAEEQIGSTARGGPRGELGDGPREGPGRMVERGMDVSRDVTAPT
jgi:hypothetical protein